MKLLLVGSNEMWSIETHYLKYLRNKPGLEVDIFSTSEFEKKHYHFLYRLEKRFFPNKNQYYRRLNNALLEKVMASRPEVILIFKGMEVFPETLMQIKGQGIKLANYNPDHPFIIYSRGSGNANVTQSVGLYDLHLCYSSSLKEEIEQRYGIPACHLPFGFELSQDVFESATLEPEVLRVCFIGNPDSIRVKHIKYLLEQQLPVDVYGHHWERFFRPGQYTNLQLFPAVYGDQFWRVARRYRVQLNVFRPHNEGSHNMRTFEIPAVGGIMLAQRSPEQDAFFASSQEAFFFRGFEELADRAKAIMSFSTSEAFQVRVYARKRSLEGRYSYQDRSNQLIAYLTSLTGVK